MGRHANGEGSIYRRKDGRYEAAAYFLTTSGTRKRIRVYGRTRVEVHDKLTDAKAKAQQGIPLPDKAWKLDSYLDYWLEQVVLPIRRPATYERAKTIVRLYLKPGLGPLQLARLSVSVVQGFVNQQLFEGRSVPTVETIRKVLSAALTRAQREELVTRNVARLVELPKYERPDRTPWTAKEAKTFLHAAQFDPLYPAFTLLALYGLRRGEVLGLRWCDVDFEHEVLHVRQQLQRISGVLRTGPLKTKAGRRDLPLLGLPLRSLRQQRITQDVAHASAGQAWLGSGTPDELVFTTRSGLPVEPRNLVRSFRRICEQHGVRVVRVHDVRHTAATLLKDMGVPARDAQLILGHADISTTQQIYQHDTLDSRHDALSKVERLFWRTTGSSRCRQILPSTRSIVEELTSFLSGATLGIRTPDPRFTKAML